MVICVVRNGIEHVESFLAHYRRIGVKHMIFLDNGSDDGTVRALSGGDITVLQSLVPYQHYENTMKRYLVRRFCRRRWCLCADIDEFFDYPRSEKIGTADLLAYLDSNGFNAVVTQMLDLFDEDGISADAINTGSLTERQTCYDTASIRAEPYVCGPEDGNVLGSDAILGHFGGIRKAFFGTDNGLTKISLFKPDSKMELFVYWHHTRNAQIADISCVLRHHPFVGSFIAKVRDAVATGRYGYLTSDEYKKYFDGLLGKDRLSMKTATTRRLKDVNQLVDEGFLVVSKRFDEWIADR